MDYEKAYKAVLQTATQWIKDGCTDKEKICLECVFPELRESEDERIRKWLVDYFGSIKKTVWIYRDITCEQILEWLEKQQENPKNAISIPADCASNAKCPYKIHGDEDFIGDIKDTPAYHFGFDEGVRSEREKQKESLHITESCKENAEYFTSQCGDNRFELIDKAKRDIIEKTNIEYSPDEMKLLNSFLFRAWQMGWLGKYDVIVPEQKPAEWSEEDEKMRTNAVLSLQYLIEECPDSDFIDSVKKEKDWLKSLRPSWKPNDNQMSMLRAIVNDPNNVGAESCHLAMQSLYNDLLKLK